MSLNQLCIIEIFYIGIMLILLQVIKIKLNLLYQNLNICILTPSKYTIMVRGLKPEMNFNKVKYIMENASLARQVNVEKIVFSYKIQHYMSQIRKKARIIQEREKVLSEIKQLANPCQSYLKCL